MDKTLANWLPTAKSANVFYRQSFVLYGTCISFIFNPHHIITYITHCKFVACQFMFTCIVITHTALDAYVAHELIDFSVLLQKAHSWMLLVTPCQQHSSPSKDFTLGNREPIRVRSAQESLSGLICCVLY